MFLIFGQPTKPEIRLSPLVRDSTSNRSSDALHEISRELYINASIPRDRLDELATSGMTNSHLAHLRAAADQLFELTIEKPLVSVARGA
jgi:hypothetical protein